MVAVSVFGGVGGEFADGLTEMLGKFGDIGVRIPIFGLDFQLVYAATQFWILAVMYGK